MESLGESERRRSKLEIAIDILDAIAEGRDRPTRIMYSANTSWIPLQQLLEMLLTCGLIIERNHNGARRYLLTEKGAKTLTYFDSVRHQLAMAET